MTRYLLEYASQGRWRRHEFSDAFARGLFLIMLSRGDADQIQMWECQHEPTCKTQAQHFDAERREAMEA